MSEDTRPTFVPICLTCKSCQAAWGNWQPLNVPVSTWIAHVRSYRCPECGAGGRNVLVRTQPTGGEAI